MTPCALRKTANQGLPQEACGPSLTQPREIRSCSRGATAVREGVEGPSVGLGLPSAGVLSSTLSLLG